MTATAASVEAQAKVNLFLRVVAREASGYHQLETLFARIELADSVRVATATAVRELRCEGADVGPMERNLAFRAAEAYRAAVGWPGGFLIEVEKRIPVGGGLGGGSADAGAVLRALNALAPRPLSAGELATLAFRLGADVPFLATDAPLALAWGRGERLLALRPLPAREVVLLIPGFGVETKAAFGWYAAALDEGRPQAPAPLSLEQLDRWEQVARLATNDLEAVVLSRHPLLAEGLLALETHGARIARMTGSGSTLFGVFDRRPAADLASAVPGVRLVQTRTLTSVAPVRLMD
jgi:4-diphosphocytidyl-2-C-methyl-D-erythritol kinase